MIRLENVNKYYNKGKSNQIHVINNTSMTLPDKGIVCLLGPSGCGKTTLLNAIGGLDKVDSGRIFIGNQRMTRFSSSKIDTIRNSRIGYIFQNFNLLDDKTVFENVAISLRMIGIKDPKIIRDRVRYCLEKTGIYKYRNKPANALSGGQRQRVAIARAIVKNPQIIIADEPTGNLDSANTLEIMNIIKTISAERLVILVTHERKIAEFYSDHIVEMKDGKIEKSYDNDSSRFLDYQLENKIYLKDLPVSMDMSRDSMNLKVYSDDDRKTDIKLVIRGNNLYIDTGGKLNIVDETANVELIDDHYTAMDENSFGSNDFDYGAYLPKRYRTKYTSIYKFSNMLSSGWKSVASFRRLKKLLLLGFVFAAMFSFLAISNILGLLDVKPEEYRTTNAHYITVSNPDKDDKLIKKIEGYDGVTFVMPGDTLKYLNLPLDDYLQTSMATETLSVSLVESSALNAGDLICGEMPEGNKGVVLDKMVAENFVRDELGKCVGIDSYEKLVGRRLTVPNVKDFIITGISDTHSPTMFVKDNQVMHILTNADDDSSFDAEDGEGSEDPIKSGKVKNLRLARSNLTVKKGRLPDAAYEVILNESHSDEYKIGKEMNFKVAGHKLKVVGFYKSDNAEEDTYFVSDHTIERAYITKQKYISVYAEDVDSVCAKLDEEGIKYKVNDTRDRKAYMHGNRESLKSSIIVAAIICFIALVEMFLMLRSSFLSRIKEVGTLRAIGLKKKDIYRMFSGEILVISLITAVPGVILMYVLLKGFTNTSYYLQGLYMINPAVAGVTLALVILFNLFAGLIPVFFTLRKTPAQILARTDI